jgi:ribosomal protein S27E
MADFRFIRVQCQGCDVQLRIDYEHAGKQVKCPACENVRGIPSTGEILEMLEYTAQTAGAKTLSDDTPGEAASPNLEVIDGIPVIEEAAAIEGGDATLPVPPAEPSTDKTQKAKPDSDEDEEVALYDT